MNEKLNRALVLAAAGLEESGGDRLAVSGDDGRGNVVHAMVVVTEPDRAKALMDLCRQWDAEDDEADARDAAREASRPA